MKPKFRALIHGVNFHIRDSDSQRVELVGFYVTAFVESHSAEDAELASVALLRDSPKLCGQVLNPPADPPRIFVEDMEELAEWPADYTLPLSGFAFYNDPDEDWRNEPKSANA